MTIETTNPNVRALQPADAARTTAIVVESLVLYGDLSNLSPEDRSRYYIQRAQSMGLDPASQPFDVITFQGKMILYIKKGAADQLAQIHNITRKVVDGPKIMDINGTKVGYICIEASLPSGRSEMEVATLPLSDPTMLFMKLISKGKRRATLAITGTGTLLTEDEADELRERGAQYVDVRQTTNGGGADTGGDDLPPGLALLYDALDSFGETCTRDQAVQLVRDHCSTYAKAPKVATEDGEAAQSAIMQRTIPPWDSARQLGLAVRHAEACDAHPLYRTLTHDFAQLCKVPGDVVVAWKMTAADVGWAKLPDDVRELARLRAAGAVTRLDPSIKQGGKWLTAQLGPDAPKPPTRGPNGRNATGDHAPASTANASGETAAAPSTGAAVASSADPERDAIQSEAGSETEAAYRLASRQQAWTDGEVTPETWQAHLREKTNAIAVQNSWSLHLPKFGRVPSPYRGVAVQRLLELGVVDAGAAGDMLDVAVRARAAKPKAA